MHTLDNTIIPHHAYYSSSIPTPESPISSAVLPRGGKTSRSGTGYKSLPGWLSSGSEKEKPSTVVLENVFNDTLESSIVDEEVEELFRRNDETMVQIRRDLKAVRLQDATLEAAMPYTTLHQQYQYHHQLQQRHAQQKTAASEEEDVVMRLEGGRRKLQMMMKLEPSSTTEKERRESDLFFPGEIPMPSSSLLSRGVGAPAIRTTEQREQQHNSKRRVGLFCREDKKALSQKPPSVAELLVRLEKVDSKNGGGRGGQDFFGSKISEDEGEKRDSGERVDGIDAVWSQETFHKNQRSDAAKTIIVGSGGDISKGGERPLSPRSFSLRRRMDSQGDDGGGNIDAWSSYQSSSSREGGGCFDGPSEETLDDKYSETELLKLSRFRQREGIYLGKSRSPGRGEKDKGGFEADRFRRSFDGGDIVEEGGRITVFVSNARALLMS